MPGLVITNEHDEYLDIFGQQPMMSKVYTPICLFYPVDDITSHDSIIQVLTKGLERLNTAFPWLAGQVVNEDASETNSGTLKILPLGKTPLLVVKDLREDLSVPTMDALRRVDFPIAMLDETVLSPRNALTMPGSPAELEKVPVLLLQANFIQGGLVLSIVANHGTMDIAGQGQIIHLFSKACRNEPFTRKEVVSGNLDPRGLIPLIEDESYKECPQLVHQIMQKFPTFPPKCTAAYFRFSSASLAALKAEATALKSDEVEFVSTDDALSVFIWQSIMRARLSRLDPADSVTLARAVDVRSLFDISATYPGLMINMAFESYTLQDLVQASVGHVASKLRSSLTGKGSNALKHHTRALATLFDRSPDKRAIAFTANLDSVKDVMFSSWAKLDTHYLDLGLGLGLPEAVKRPDGEPGLESLVHVMPKTVEGDLSVAISLRDEDMEKLKSDEEFLKFGTFVG